MVDHDGYKDTWYNRHREPVHSHSGRVAPHDNAATATGECCWWESQELNSDESEIESSLFDGIQMFYENE